MPILGRIATRYRYHLCRGQMVPVPSKVVLVPLTKTKVVPVPRQSGTGTNFQNMIGTSTNPSGTGTTASDSPDFCIRALLSSKCTVPRHRGGALKWVNLMLL